jgi:P27 family predicted phage terminase small subunit
MAGRRPKPLAMHRAGGNPSKLTKEELRGANNPDVKPGIPEMPRGLPKAGQREWHNMAPMLLDLGVLAVTNGKALWGYCMAYAIVEACAEHIEENGLFVETMHGLSANPALPTMNKYLATMKSYLIEFGLTPASVSKLKIQKKSEADPYDKIMGGKSEPLLTPVSPEEMLAGDETDPAGE